MCVCVHALVLACNLHQHLMHCSPSQTNLYVFCMLTKGQNTFALPTKCIRLNSNSLTFTTKPLSLQMFTVRSGIFRALFVLQLQSPRAFRCMCCNEMSYTAGHELTKGPLFLNVSFHSTPEKVQLFPFHSPSVVR